MKTLKKRKKPVGLRWNEKFVIIIENFEGGRLKTLKKR